ncbi:hypothetical protein DH2020_048935 [Rehmannia glutinosa]|uniref:Peptidase A2 domain-containing protein n=1 Tax=Rehmannia glutinosa TaxID=99300 RepID=A0ABR0U4V7_REHGL
MRRVFVDTGSSADILFYDCYRKMDLQVGLETVDTALVGFFGGMIEPIGMITLPVSLGKEPNRKTRMIRFLIVDAPCSYNAMLGRPSLNAFQAVVSFYHLKMKFPVGEEVGEVGGDQYMARKLYVESIQKAERGNAFDDDRNRDKLIRLDEPVEHVQPNEEMMMVELVPGDPDKVTNIGKGLADELREEPVKFLRSNVDVFAWTTEDLVGIDPSIAVAPSS